MPTAVIVSPIVRVGNGMSAELFPERIHHDGWAYPIISPGTSPDHLLGHARRATGGCPTVAVLFPDATDGPGTRQTKGHC